MTQAGYGKFKRLAPLRRDGRVVEGARLESVFRGNSNVGSNPTLSARILRINNLQDTDTDCDTGPVLSTA